MRELKDNFCFFFFPQTCFLHWIYWSLLRATAFPECSAPPRHRKIVLSSLRSRGIKASALLSQNQTPCCSDSGSLRLISPGVSFHLLTRIIRWQKVHVAESLINVIPLFKQKQDKVQKKAFSGGILLGLFVKLHLENNGFRHNRPR